MSGPDAPDCIGALRFAARGEHHPGPVRGELTRRLESEAAVRPSDDEGAAGLVGYPVRGPTLHAARLPFRHSRRLSRSLACRASGPGAPFGLALCIQDALHGTECQVCREVPFLALLEAEVLE